MGLAESKAAMTDFYARLEANEKERELRHSYQNTRGAKFNKINEESSKLKEGCIQGLLSKIYYDALPVDDAVKSKFAAELDEGMHNFIKRRSSDGTCCGYITESIKHGSIPAKQMMESVEEHVNDLFKKYYPVLEETDVDDIKATTADKESIIDLVSADMAYPEISSIIEGNVQQTIQQEMEQQKIEDDKVTELQKALESDESVATEESVDEALERAGMQKSTYVPSLFSGIMINRIDAIMEDARENGKEIVDEDVKQQAFVEATEEFTKLATISVLNMEDLNKYKVRDMAVRYARGDIKI